MKHYRPVLFLIVFFLCLVSGFWAGKQARNSLQGETIDDASAWTPKQANEKLESEPITALAEAPPPMPTYPVPAAIEPEALVATETTSPTPVPSHTPPPTALPTSSPTPETVVTPAPPTVQIPVDSIQSEEPGGSQRNILVIGVDDLYAQPARLISAWLVMYVTGSQHFIVMPVYPQVNPQENQPAPPPDSLIQKFSLDPSGDPSREFLQALKERGAWWNTIITLDQTVIQAVIEIAYYGEHLPEKSVLLPAVSTDPQDAQDVLLAQAWLGQKLCQNLAEAGRDETMQVMNLLSLIPVHMRTDLELHSVRAELESILAHSTDIVCEIPVLSGGGVEP